MRLSTILLIATALASIEAPVIAQPSLGSGTVMEAAERLKPGEYLWAPEVAPAGPMLMIVNLRTQRLVLYRNGLPIAISTVSTGRPGYRTPTGIFTILQRREVHFSSIYDNAPMPFMQRLTWGGVALHGGNLPGYPASHGCIRLPHEFARLLYGATKLGMTVVVTDRPSVPRIAPSPQFLRSGSPAGWPAPGGAPFSWTPERSPSGPVSVVISGADRRVTILRNGIIIGSAPIAIRGKIEETSAYVLRSTENGRAEWMRVPLPGQEARTEIREDEKGRFETSEEFSQKVRPIILPGTTVVVTGDPLQADGPRGEVTVLADEEEPD